MNNLRKSAVMLLVGVFVISMLMVPFVPMAADSQVAQALPDSMQQDTLRKWADRVENDMVGEKMDPLLVSYMDTGVVDQSLYLKSNGDIKLLLYLDAGFDNSLLYKLADVNWQMDFVVSRVASVSVSSVAALKQIEATDGIRYVQADRLIDRAVESEPISELDMFNINDEVGATAAAELGYNGTGAIVAIDDSGIDFSHPDLIGTEYNNGSYGMSYDPSGMGLTDMYIANGSYVENTTAWLEAGYLLTYNGTDGNMYVDVDGWNPICNNGGGHRPLLAGGFIGLYEGAWGIANATEYVMSELWNDWQIPDPIVGQNYTFGWAFQQRNDGYAKVFAPSMIYDGDVIIDWNGTYAFTNMWMDGFWWESADFTDLDDRAYYADMMDWSFNDDIAENYVFNGENTALAADLDDDGMIDVGIGSLSWAYDDIGYLANEYDDVFFGITPDWLGWNALFNHDSNHGTWTAAAVAGQGVLDYEVYDNTTTWIETSVVDGKTVVTEKTETSLYTLPGVAVGAKIMSCKGISSGGGLMADFWGAGFHLNNSAGPYGNWSYWEYTLDGRTHHADIVSNSWGWGPGGSYLQLYEYALMYDLASADGILHPDYGGTLFVFSAGNDGNDYGTSGTPGGSYSVVSVGATYTSHFYESLYGNTQTDGQQVHWSATGPGFTGIVKPDVMAPGFRGVNPQPYSNIWLDTGDSYFWWQGTSLSCPVAAGVAAIIIDAYNQTYDAFPSPQYVKNVLLSTATDIGIDPFAQGHGLVNALAAVEAIENQDTDKYFFESDSYKLFGDQVADSWDAWMYDANLGSFFGIFADNGTPVGMESSSIFFGSVNPGDTVNVNLSIADFNGGAYDTTPFDTLQALEYEQSSVIEFDLISSFYNDTNFMPWVVRPMSFNIYNNMSGGEVAAFNAAAYATIQVAFDADDTGTVVRLFDWTDSDMNGDLNYWNFDPYVLDGDIVDHVARGTNPCNLETMRIGGTPTLGDLFDGVPTLQLDATEAGVAVNVTIQLWSYADVTSTEVFFSDITGGIQVQLQVPDPVEYGIHQGQILLADTSSSWSHKVPYSYMVDFTMDGTDYGGNQTLVDGPGSAITPYDTGTTTTAFVQGTTRTDESGGIDVFRIHIPYSITVNASIVVIRAEWEHSGTVIDFQVRNDANGVEAATDWLNPIEPTKNTVIWDYEDLVNGSYWFLVYTAAFSGESVPEDIKITFQLYNATTFSDATYVNGWTSNTMTTPTSFDDAASLVGDHVEIKTNWTLPAVAGLPEYSISSSKIALLSGLHAVMTGSYPETDIDAWPIALSLTDDYAWETVEGITAGDNVRVVLDAQGNSDPSFDVWSWDDVNDDGLVDWETELSSTSHLSVDNGGGGTPESGAYVAAESGDIAIRVFCWGYSWNHQDYSLDVDTRASVDIWDGADPSVAEFDTYELRRNITMTVQYYCYTDTDVMFMDELGTVTFANFFAPDVTVNAPVEIGTGTNIWNLTWSSTDQNAADVPYYSVWLSRDAGVTFVLLQQNLTATNYTWDSTTWLEASYIVRVRAYSCDFLNWTTLGYTDGIICNVGDPPTGYWPGDFTDGFSAAFNAGDVPPVTTTTTTTPPPVTTTTTTTTPPPVPAPPLDPLLIGLLGGIGVGVVVLLILFLVRKK